jgi:hypothetical protein
MTIAEHPQRAPLDEALAFVAGVALICAEGVVTGSTMS